MSGWIDHNSTCFPLFFDTRVDISTKSGELRCGLWASDLNWGKDSDIAQYRIVDETPTPAPSSISARMADALADPMTAPAFCQKAADLMAERGKTYDKGGKAERSMAATVTAFNAITGRDLSEPEGWLLMSLVKRVRQYQNPSFHRDSAEDAVAYAALEAEALAAEEAA